MGGWVGEWEWVGGANTIPQQYSNDIMNLGIDFSNVCVVHSNRTASLNTDIRNHLDGKLLSMSLHFHLTSQLTPTTLDDPAPAPNRNAPGSPTSLAISAMSYNLEQSGSGNR